MDEAMAARREGVVRAERILALNPWDGRALAMGSQALYVTGEVERAMATPKERSSPENSLIWLCCHKTSSQLRRLRLPQRRHS
jgi:hypothetical protein